jgi:transcriptional regulator with XRE-family HTH domain
MAEDTKATGSARRERLTRRRKALGLTQEDLAALLGVERTTVARWERGQTEPGPWIQPKLAKALRVPADQLEELLDGGGPAGSARDAGTWRGGATAVARQPPCGVVHFTGRAAELAALTRILDDAVAGAPGTVVICCAIGGTAGVGKTAPAIQWAHQAADRFPDGQLSVNLRGYDPDQSMPAADALAWFLRARGVPGQDIPSEEDERAALYCSLLACKKLLIVLECRVGGAGAAAAAWSRLLRGGGDQP